MSGTGFEEIAEPSAAEIGIGHNMPPAGLPVGDDLRLEVQKRHADLLKRAKALLEMSVRLPRDRHGNVVCETDDVERKMIETIKSISKCETALDTARMSEKAPYEEAAGIIHGLFRELQDGLVDPIAPGKRRTASNALKERIAVAVTAFQRKKADEQRQRLEAEAQRRRDAEAAEQRRVAEAQARAQAAEQERRRQEEAARQAERDAEAARQQAERRRLEANRQRDEEAVRQAQAAQREAEEAARRAAEQRQAQERAAEEAREAEARAAEERATAERAAAVKSADLTRVRSDTAVSSLKEYIDFRDIERSRIDLELLRDHLPSDAFDQAVRSYVRANKDFLKDEMKNGRQPLRGVVLFTNYGTAVR